MAIGRVFKYAQRRHAGALVELGCLRVGTLYEYRNTERHQPGVADAGEGTRVLVEDIDHADFREPASVPPLLKTLTQGLEGTESIFRNTLIAINSDAPDCYIYSVSSRFFDASVLGNVFPGYDSCVEIDDFEQFIKPIEEELQRRELIVGSAAIRPCIYGYRHILASEASSLSPAFIKPPRFRHQQEIRAVWRARPPGIEAKVLECSPCAALCHLIYPTAAEIRSITPAPICETEPAASPPKGLSSESSARAPDPSLSRWKDAVVHLEAAGNSLSYDEQAQRVADLQNRPGSEQDVAVGSHDVRVHGTALFVLHNNRHFLITARRVLYDKLGAQRVLEDEFKKLDSYPPRLLNRDVLTSRDIESARDTIFPLIFRVPSLDEVEQNGPLFRPHYLMNLAPDREYTFSVPELDLAIISLEGRKHFSDELIAAGFAPIKLLEIADIAEQPSAEGASVFTVGYPLALGRLHRIPAAQHWSSSLFSVPTFSFGRVAMLHPELYYFWSEMSVGPGNAGGPVVEGDSLVGIVSQLELEPAAPANEAGPESAIGVPVGITLGRIIKARHVRPLVEAQLAKDRRYAKGSNAET